jgi:hypothetical protein
VRSIRAVAVITASLLWLVSCGHKEISREQAVDLITTSESFQGPWDPGIVFVDAQVRRGPNTKREILRIEGLTIKEDGPFGVAGATATAAFTWRWNEGPFAQRIFRSKVRFNSATGEKRWKIYEDYLQSELWKAERGELAE